LIQKYYLNVTEYIALIYNRLPDIVISYTVEGYT